MAGFHETLANDLSEVDRINERFGAFAKAQGLPDKLRQQMALVFDEVVANIVLYGYDDDAAHTIEVDVQLDAGVMTITVDDDGIAFDPLARAAPDVSSGVEDREIGGLGIHLVRTLMDEMSWQRRGERNVLVLIKHVA